jgi:hypothetical protein
MSAAGQGVVPSSEVLLSCLLVGPECFCNLVSGISLFIFENVVQACQRQRREDREGVSVVKLFQETRQI